MTNLFQEFHGPNAGYLLDAYEQYLADPDSVDPELKTLFQHVTPSEPPSVNGAHAPASAAPPAAIPYKIIVDIANLAREIRQRGFNPQNLDPLGMKERRGIDEALSRYELSEDILHRMPGRLVGGPLSHDAPTAYEGIQRLRNVYSQSKGFEYMHLDSATERYWIREHNEAGTFSVQKDPIDQVKILERLTKVEAFEQFLHRLFPGKKRFSIEGLDMMVPILELVISEATHYDIFEVLIGMAHRGRLNVLAHVLGKSYEAMLAEFKDPINEESEDGATTTGDVKYHAGALRQIMDEDNTVDVRVSIAANPSHLEHVNPVVTGMARAAGTEANQPGKAIFDQRKSLPVLIHGDAAFAGQGIVTETLNFNALKGYRTGGTLHIIANNQVGFTTKNKASRSTLFASDNAKGYNIPIVHVNADDVAACLEVARLASAFMHEFQKDFVIDLIGYRRYGHNEGDEPRFTQPNMYKVIDKHPRVREIWAEKLVADGAITKDQADQMLSDAIAHLQTIWDGLDEKKLAKRKKRPAKKAVAPKVKTSVSAAKLRSYHNALLDFPQDFALNSRLARILKRRVPALDNLDDATIDWGLGEALAFASIIADGTPCRLTGEDVERGTFSHRHALLHDSNSGKAYIPLHNLPQAKASFEIRNSALSENAAVGFEYGYSLHAPGRLVMWEAQFGDFVDGAQVMIDEFITSGHVKWDQFSSLVMLLPHGHEGMGPDHSSARPERFLQMAADDNMRIANPGSAAQMFHLLRRQAALLQKKPRPLIVFTPKSLLRHPVATSTLRELTQGSWQPVIDDAKADKEQVSRLVLCTGKVNADLQTSPYRDASPKVAIVRMDQLYPVPVDELYETINSYPNLKEVVWLQEEPKNMGAWSFISPTLRRIIGSRYALGYVGRNPAASPAEGSTNQHKMTQDRIIKSAFDMEAPVTMGLSF